MGFFINLKKTLITFAAAFTLVASIPAIYVQQIIPVTTSVLTNEAKPAESSIVPLDEFTKALNDGNSKSIKGIYAAQVLSLKVVQQPSGNPGFVSPAEGTATEFRMASKNNVIGMLAHNFAAGRHFSNLNLDDVVDVVYGDGTIKEYKITQIKRYQALSPKSASSDFLDMDTNEKLSANSLFNKVYTGNHHLTLQTCIQVGKEDSWGRLFVIAEPVES
jgi:hypothetical protein